MKSSSLSDPTALAVFFTVVCAHDLYLLRKERRRRKEKKKERKKERKNKRIKERKNKRI